MNSYQKLKKKNEELQSDIYRILRGKPVEQIETKIKWEMKLDLADMMNYGSCPMKGDRVYSLLDYMKSPENTEQ